MKKRLLSLAMALAMCLCLLPAAAFAADSEVVLINKENFPDDNFRTYVQDLPGALDGEFTRAELDYVSMISCSGNKVSDDKKITSLKGIEHFSNLRYLDCSYNNLTVLNLKLVPELSCLDCSGNKIDYLDLSQVPNLEFLYCAKNRLTQLEFSQHPELSDIYCGYNQLTQLDLSNLPGLVHVDCFGNQLTQLKLGNHPHLFELECSHNRLTTLDLSNAPVLYRLYCNHNMLTALDLRSNPDLYDLECLDNELATLDLNQDAKPNNVRCWYNAYFLSDGTPLSEVPGLDLSKVGKVNGGSFDNGKAAFTNNVIAYDYDTGATNASDKIVTLNLRRSFSDVPDGMWYTRPVRWAVIREITSGMTSTEFGADALCNRAQIVTFLWKFVGCPRHSTKENPFTDVPDDAWYTKAVLWAVEAGITKGMSETTFGPTEPCSRAQAMTFIWAVRNKLEADNDIELPFTDVPKDAWYYKAVRWAVERGVTGGLTPTEFGPTVPCNRAQILTFLYQL